MDENSECKETIAADNEGAFTLTHASPQVIISSLRRCVSLTRRSATKAAERDILFCAFSHPFPWRSGRRVAG